MPGSRALRRLLRVREINEEQSRLALQAAMAELHALDAALARSRLRQRQGRALIARSTGTGVLSDRLAGVAECAAAARDEEALSTRRSGAQARVAEVREAYLAARIERRQAEKLVEAAEAQAALDAARHGQQGLDDWFRARLSARKPKHR